MEGVLFDLDGTLIDTAPDFYRVLNIMRADLGLSALDYDSVRMTVSDGARALLQLAFNIDENDHEFELMRQSLLDMYLEGIAVESRLFQGLEQLLEWLDSESIPWGIVTNKPRLYAEPLLNQLGLTDRLKSLVCPDDVILRKPHAEPMLKACKELNTNPRKTVYVGDHKRDIEAGKAAGMPTIAAGYGYIHNPDEAASWKADLLCQSSETLMQTLKRQQTAMSDRLTLK